MSDQCAKCGDDLGADHYEVKAWSDSGLEGSFSLCDICAEVMGLMELVA